MKRLLLSTIGAGVIAAIGVLFVAPSTPIQAQDAGQANVLILADADTPGTTALATALTTAGNNVTVRTPPENTWDGTNPSLAAFDVVVHLNGATPFQSLSATAQQTLQNFVVNGGGFVAAQWNGYERDAGTGTAMPDLVLQDWPGPNNCPPPNVCVITYTAVAAQTGHPVLAGVPASFSFPADGHDDGPQVMFESNPSTVLMTASGGADEGQPPGTGPAVLVRDNVGTGRVVNFSWAPNYLSAGLTLQDLTVQKLYVNAVAWAARRDTDTDDDGVADAVDNCRFVPNPFQENSDVIPDPSCEDGLTPAGTLCTALPSPDAFGDACDSCAARPNTGDSNEDGVDDACQTRTEPQPFNSGAKEHTFNEEEHGNTVELSFDNIPAGSEFTCWLETADKTVAEELPKLATLNFGRALTDQLMPIERTDRAMTTVVYSILCDADGNPLNGRQPLTPGTDYVGLAHLEFAFHGDPTLLTKNVVDVAQAKEAQVQVPIDQYDLLLRKEHPESYSFTTASCDCFVGVGTDGFSDFLLVYDPVELDPTGEPATAFSGFLSPYKPGGYVKKGTFPIKFQLTDKATGMFVEDPEAFITIRRRGEGGTHSDEVIEATSTIKSIGNRFRYDAASKTHIYNWDMNSVPPGDYVFTLNSSMVGNFSGFVTKK